MLISNLSLFGTESNDTLSGGSGYDYLVGGLGDDSMAGGIGDDLYIVDSSFDQVVEYTNEGFDTVRSSVSYTLGANLERLTLTDNAESGFGNELNNNIIANDADNYLSGGDGNDMLFGWAGNDTMLGDQGDDYLLGGEGDDALEGGEGNDTLYGVVGNDTLVGGAGDDVLVGGAGYDVLTGGVGADQFEFYFLSNEADIITDFQPLEGDKICVCAPQLGGGLALGELSSNMLTFGSTAATASDRFIYDSSTGELFFDADGTGNTEQVHLATLAPGLSLASSAISVFSF